MTRCYICEGVGINTVADSSEPIVVDGIKFKVCKDCHLTHTRALERGARTMFDRLFSAEFRAIKARATHKPRAKPTTKLTILPADEE